MSVLLLADAKTYLRINGDDDDAELQATIDSAEATIADKVGPLSVVSVSERVESDGCTLVLSRAPYVALTTVSGVYPAEMLTVGDLRVDAQVVSYANGYTGFTGRYYDVTYTVGYATVPADLLSGVKELVRHRWRPQRGGVNRPGTAADADEITYRGNLPRPVYELIEDYLIDDDLGFA